MIIPTEIFALYNQEVDDMINSNFGVTCTLYYPEKTVQCDNCIFDPVLKKSSNIYKAGGPISFSNGLCPYCNGYGKKVTIPTDSIKVRAYYNKKAWYNVPVSIDIPDGSVQTIGFMSDFAKIKMCTHIRIHTSVEGYGAFEYLLFGEPIPHGFKKNRYCIAMWRRK